MKSLLVTLSIGFTALSTLAHGAERLEKPCESILTNSSEVLSLRETRRADWSRIQQIVSDPQIIAMSGDKPWTEESVKDGIRLAMRGYRHPETWYNLIYALTLGRKTIGFVQLYHGFDENGWVNYYGSSIGFFLDPAYWGRGHTTDALKLAVKFAFEHLDSEELHAATSAADLN